MRRSSRRLKLVDGGGGGRAVGRSRRRADLRDEPRTHGWTRWSIDRRSERSGRYELGARVTARRGDTRPERAVVNREGYPFDAVVVPR
ncbi:hypothetical protein ACIPLC_14275 [Kitasatospora sp. NPDC086801]|uniref:hypothetical protein n=1 Tax=Kitasatospora sp. NPDC086801 TaxID=3364066 RepID=UPI003805F4F6